MGMTIFSVMCIRSIALINSLTEVDEISHAPVMMPGANRVMIDVIASTIKESRPLKYTRATAPMQSRLHRAANIFLLF